MRTQFQLRSLTPKTAHIFSSRYLSTELTLVGLGRTMSASGIFVAGCLLWDRFTEGNLIGSRIKNMGYHNESVAVQKSDKSPY